jgi:high-affinity nickel-transport protein
MSRLEQQDTTSPNLKANAQLTPRSTFTELIRQQRLSLWFPLTAAMISMALGALHALEPGHGKTLVAAYLVGSRGTATHAVLLGLIVTLAHTAGVYVLGAITLYASRYVLPERLYPWLGAVSGAIIALLGVLLFIRRWAAADSLLGEGHTHWYDRFAGVNLDDKQSDASATNVAQQVSIRQLLVLGIVGGLVPCPAALVVLLSALALHRIIFGFFLILSFSFGLAAVLIGIGLLIVHAAKLVSGLNADTELIRRRLPLLSAAAITVVGLSLVVQSIKNDAVVTQLNAVVGAKWLLVGGIGLLLGMRHSTDADHVIAVTTIVSRLRSVRHAGVVGMLWGIGHTLTIVIIGSAIILFGIVIPPRIGLSLEFAVALMLVLLGVLNLAGVLARLARRFSTTNLPDQPSLVIAHEGAEWAGAASIATKLGTYQLLKPLVIGVVHGLAGSAAVALMVLATIHEPVWAIAYLLLFGLGTIAGMMLMTAIIAFPIVWTGNGFAHWNRLMTATSGIVSVAFGLFLIYRIGFISGLFSSGPKWMPG